MASVTSWLQSGTCIGTPPQVMCGLGGIHFGLRQLCLESCGVSYRLQFSHSPTKQLRFRPRLCKNLQLNFIRCPTWPVFHIEKGSTFVLAMRMGVWRWELMKRKSASLLSRCHAQNNERTALKIRFHFFFIRDLCQKFQLCPPEGYITYVSLKGHSAGRRNRGYVPK